MFVLHGCSLHNTEDMCTVRKCNSLTPEAVNDTNSFVQITTLIFRGMRFLECMWVGVWVGGVFKCVYVQMCVWVGGWVEHVRDL